MKKENKKSSHNPQVGQQPLCLVSASSSGLMPTLPDGLCSHIVVRNISNKIPVMKRPKITRPLLSIKTKRRARPEFCQPSSLRLASCLTSSRTRAPLTRQRATNNPSLTAFLRLSFRTTLLVSTYAPWLDKRFKLGTNNRSTSTRPIVLSSLLTR